MKKQITQFAVILKVAGKAIRYVCMAHSSTQAIMKAENALDKKTGKVNFVESATAYPVQRIAL